MDKRLIGNNSQSSLSVRFENFIRTVDGFENIDELLQRADPHGKKRADYLVHNRRIIIEQKTLRSNPTGKPQKFVDKLARERGITIIGTVSTDQIFARQPDATDLQRRMVLDLARAVKDNVSDADKQATATRELFNIPDALGILVLLNESASYLPPDVIHYTLANSFHRKNEDGTFRYVANDGVIVISEASSLSTSPKNPAFPILPFVGPSRRREAEFSQFSERLMREWAAFNNATFLTMPVDINLKPK